MKRWTALFLSCCLLLSGCSAVSDNVEGLLHPPKLSEEQSKIHEALIAQVGKNIHLKYPKSGEYHSSIIIADIDGEPTEEAMVFYERTDPNGGKTGLRMNILDQQDGEWFSVFDHGGAGSDVEQVMIYPMGLEQIPVFAVGYSKQGQSDKTMRIYRYQDGRLSILYEDRYAMMESADLDQDGGGELLVVSGKSSVSSAAATLLKLESGEILVKSIVGMDNTVNDYAAMIFGRLSDGTPAFFVDGVFSDDLHDAPYLQTQIIYSSDGRLRNPLERAREMMVQTIRPQGYLCRDIDGDGVVEIPRLSPFPGYEGAEADDRMDLTEWYSFEQYMLALKNSGYYDAGNNYCFMIPSRWKGSVTVRLDVASDEVVFYKYSGSLEDSTEELLRLSVMPQGVSSEKLENGYETFFTREPYEYLVKYPKYSSEPLVLTRSEIMYNFIIW